MTNFNVSNETRLKTCEKNFQCWQSLQNERLVLENTNNDVISTTEQSNNIASCFPCVSSAFRWIARGRDANIGQPDLDAPETPEKLLNAKHTQVVVTGSLHLVGTVMKFLGPEICEI